MFFFIVCKKNKNKGLKIHYTFNISYNLIFHGIKINKLMVITKTLRKEKYCRNLNFAVSKKWVIINKHSRINYH